MRQFFYKYRKFLLLFAAVSGVILLLFYRALKPKPALPIFQPAGVNAELVDNSIQYVKKFHRIADFELQNQNGENITHKKFDGKIYIADFIFTTCPSICPIMTTNMGEIQQQVLQKSHVQLVSFSVTPQIDSVPQLKKYALEKGVVDTKWDLLTGPKKTIYDLARKSYLVAKIEPNGDPYALIHTENFVLVDPLRRIRGYYDGTNSEAMQQLLEDLQILEAEFFEESEAF